MKRKIRIYPTACRFLAIALTAGLGLSMYGCQGTSGSSNGNRLDASLIREDNTAAGRASDSDTFGSDAAGSALSDSTASDLISSDSTASVTRTEYPLTITTYGAGGTEYTMVFEKAPERVVAVYQGCIETLLALGLGDRIVAAAGLDNSVPDSMKNAFSSINYLDEFTPSKETVTMLEPDFIFSWSSYFQDDTLGSPKDWSNSGTNVYINTNTSVQKDSLENEFNDILNIGKIFDVQDKAEAIVRQMKDTIAQVKEAAAAQSEHPSVLIIENMNGSFTNYGADSIAGDMVLELGGTLASPDASALGKEDIIAANPDVIFVVYMPYAGDDPESVRQEHLDNIIKDEVFSSLDAVKNGRVIPIMLSEMYASATRTQDGIETIAHGLYPELEED